MFIFSIIARYLALIVCYPLLRCTKYNPTMDEFVLLGWSGLKGSHGLILSLVVAHESELFSEAMSEQIVL